MLATLILSSSLGCGTTLGSFGTALSIDPEPGVYSSARIVTISSEISGAVRTLVTSATYAVAPTLSGPAISPASGSYMTPQAVSITAPAPGRVIHYTTDGSVPTTRSPVYDGKPIAVGPGRATITAMVEAIAGYAQSQAAAHAYTVFPATPFISPTSGTYTTARSVKIVDTTAGATIYYTTDGSAPTIASPVYTGPFNTPSTASTKVVRAFAVLGGVYGSPASATYVIAPLAPTPTPIISPGAGTYTSNQVVGITDPIGGAGIYYTLDGTTPTSYSTRYTGPFAVLGGTTGSVTVQAVAILANYLPSSIARTTIKVTLPAGVIATTILTGPAQAIPSNFLGFSHEWTAAPSLMGDASLGVNTIYRTLVDTLTTTMVGPLVLRIGGGSTDSSGPATPATVEPFAELAQSSNVNFILGVNLGKNDISLAEEQAQVFTSDLHRSALAAIEIGNEPDGYSTNGLRPSTYTYPEYRPQFEQWSRGVSSVSTTPIPIAAPSLGAGFWIPNVQQDIAAFVLQPAMVTQHKYVVCVQAGTTIAPDILLQPGSSTSGLWALQPYVAAAHLVHAKFRMGEINSICNGGQAGISDTFSSALWAIDTMFEDANVGVDGVNWNTNYNGGPYDLFHFRVWNNGTKNIYTLTQVHPLFYGLLFFAQAAGNNAQLLASSTLTNSNIKVWVTQDRAGKSHLVIINKEQKTAGTVQVTLPGYSSGNLVSLNASSYLATSGVTLAGQTYDGSPDGALQGTQVTETVAPSNGVWNIPVQPVSAVMVNLQP
jgi:hypothetical protein